MRKLIFLRPGRLGDMIVVTPLFRGLKQVCPDLHITVVSSPYNEIIIRHNPFIDCIRKVNFHSLFSLLHMVFWIRKQKFDWLIDLTPEISRTSTIISFLVRSASTRTAGMHKGWASKYFDKVTDLKDVHIIERHRYLVEQVMECTLAGPSNPDFFYLQEHADQAEKKLLAIAHKKFLIGINCSAGKPCRQWNENNYRELIRMLSQKFPEAALVFFAVGKQVEWVEYFVKEIKDSVAVTSVSFLTVVAAIRKLAYFFTPDTSLLHVATGYNLPIVGLYFEDGENLVRWRATGNLTRELVASNNENVNEISPVDAFHAIEELIDINMRNTYNQDV